jgi:A/G-specific adenine glycosylase
MSSEAKPQRLSREICYALHAQNGSLLLVKRPANVSLMAGMWELPEVTSSNGDHPIEFTVRHSITVTDYVVRVTSGTPGEVPDAKWIAKSRLKSLPLTGLTKKILRRAGII